MLSIIKNPPAVILFLGAPILEIIRCMLPSNARAAFGEYNGTRCVHTTSVYFLVNLHHGLPQLQNRHQWAVSGPPVWHPPPPAPAKHKCTNFAVNHQNFTQTECFPNYRQHNTTGQVVNISYWTGSKSWYSGHTVVSASMTN